MMAARRDVRTAGKTAQMNTIGRSVARQRARTHLITFGYVIQTESEDRESGLPGKYVKYNKPKERTVSLAHAHFFDTKEDAVNAIGFISPRGASIFEDGFPRVMFAQQFDRVQEVRS